MFKIELVIKYKSLSLAWFISQAKLELNIMLLSLRSNTSILLNSYQAYYLAYLVWICDLNS